MPEATSILRADPAAIPPLENGDHLSRREYHRRYQAMPESCKAELIEGVVYLASAVSHENHGRPHAHVLGWLVTYAAATPGVDTGCESSIFLDDINEPQPDATLRILPSHGGQSGMSRDYIENAPEFIAEVSSTTASYDLHPKLEAYRRNGVREYVVWRVRDGALDWFVLRGEQYERRDPDADGVHRSAVFPGLWLDLAGNMSAVLQGLQRGLDSPDHTEFVKQLRRRASSRGKPPGEKS